MHTFSDWQPRYAKHKVPLFPVEITPDRKKPKVRGYLYTSMASSAQFALAFPDAQAFGFPCGARSGLTIVDMDSSDDGILDEGEKLFGASPLIWRTGGGKFAAAYRYNGEARRIRPIPTLPIDLLGGGYAVAPPSLGTVGRYEIIKGDLSDLDRLPMIQGPPHLASPRSCPRPRSVIPQGQRNDTLFRYALQQARHVDDEATLLDVVRTQNDAACEDLLPDAEIVKLVASAWRYQKQGRNFSAGGGSVVGTTFDEIDTLAQAHPDAFALLVILRRYHFQHDRFALANAMAGEKLKWTIRRFRTARDALVEAGLIQCVHRGGCGVGDVPLYKLAY
jgi:hypothetical protein